MRLVSGVLHPPAARRSLAVVVVALAVLCTPALAAAQQVTVAPEGGAEQTLNLADLASQQDVVARPYTVVDAAGVESTLTVTGISLDALLRAANVDPYGFDGLEALDVARGSVVFTRRELISPTAFEDGPPVVYADDQGTYLLRPRTAAGAAVRVAVAPGAPLRLTLYEGPRLEVKVRASTKRTKPGRRVTFTATVTGVPEGVTPICSWTFDDGRGGTGTRVTHRFAKPGSYDVLVGVTTPDDERGVDARVTVRVGKAPADGPNRKGGGTNENSNAPDSGVGVGAPGAGGGPTGGGAPAATPPAAARPAAAPPVPSPAPDRAPPQPSQGGQQELVEGTLLADAGVEPSPSHVEAVVAARTGNPDADDGGLSGLPTAGWGLLATMGLLALGAGFELRHGPARERT